MNRVSNVCGGRGCKRKKKGSMIKGIKVLKVVERRHERIVEEICIYLGPICLGFFCC